MRCWHRYDALLLPAFVPLRVDSAIDNLPLLVVGERQGAFPRKRSPCGTSYAG